MIQAKTEKSNRLSHGDILRDIEHITNLQEISGELIISKVMYPYIIILTQDCDLMQDFRYRSDSELNDKLLMSVLVAPLYNAEMIYSGEHLHNLGRKAAVINKGKTDGKFLRKNQNPRYHYLEFPEEIPIVDSVVDFKHYFSVPVQYLEAQKETKFGCGVSKLFREDISQRFSAFLSRIALPE
jgi:hypothetical protein